MVTKLDRLELYADLMERKRGTGKTAEAALILESVIVRLARDTRYEGIVARILSAYQSV